MWLVELTTAMRCAGVDSMAYTFGSQSGVLYYSFPASQRPTTDSDQLAFGFFTDQRHAAIASVTSFGRHDLVLVDLASRLAKTHLLHRDWAHSMGP